MDDRSNTIAGWVLGAGIVALGASIVTGEMFKAERPEKMGYPIEGVETPDDGAAAEVPIATFLATADAGKGEQVFKKCVACHTINQGGAHGTGPNLWAIMGAPVAAKPGFDYSADLKGLGGNWDWDRMNAWLASPKGLVQGTKMAFAGIAKPEDRANLMVYLNAQGSNIPLPPPPAEPEPAPADNAAAPALNETEAARQPEGNIGGEGAPEVAGNSAQEKN